MSFEKYQEIIQLEDKVERADTEFSQDLWIIAERILLQRLTRTSDKGPKLNSILQVIKRISAESEHPQGSQIERTKTAGSYHYVEDESNLSSGLSLAVELLERMDSAQMYRLISWLRNADSSSTDLAIEIPSREKNETREETTTSDNIFNMSQSDFQSTQKTLYDKFGVEASVVLYNMGEGYGNEIASDFKKRDLRLEPTIREIEKAAHLAGWGEIHLHRASENEVECVIKNTMFSFDGEGIKCSCYFAAGLLGGIISSLFMKQERFIATEIECVVGGHDSCKFKITRSAELKQVLPG